MAGPAGADTSPTDPGDPATPPTASATALPTVQIDGVAWSQAIIGETVYVAGKFAYARPAGEPATTTNRTERANLLAYDIRTGNLITSWAPATNAQVLVIKASTDGSRVYIGGDFTTVNGQTQRRVAAIDAVTGELVAGFRPNPDSQVRALAVTADTVYFGGWFGAVNGQARSRLAAARVSDGGLLTWAPTTDAAVWALAISPDETQVLVAGQFTTLNGSDRPGKGLGSVDPVTGASLPWEANNTLIRNASVHAAITALATDANSVYATGYTMSDGGGTLEGTVRMSWEGGRVLWVADCHGDSYGVHSDGQAVYVVSHAHYCGNIPGGFHDTEPWTFKRATAFSQSATQTARKEYGRWFNFAGRPAPSILHWFPRLDAGTYTGMSQGAWTITGNSDYVVAGGEFPRAGQLVNQYGLVRFAKKGVPGNANNSGPQVPGSSAAPLVTSPGAGEALVTWRTNWDRDNVNLTYQVARRSGSTTTVETRTVQSTEWSRPYQSFLDTGLSAGTYSYRITVRDPDGNAVVTSWVPVTVSGAGQATDGYARTVLGDGPQHYWRLGEDSGSAMADYTGLDGATAGSGVTRDVAGAVEGDGATRFSGTSSQSAATGTARTSSSATSVEAWFRTPPGGEGKIVGLGNSRTGSSTSAMFDRHLYIDSQGRVTFGARQGNLDTSLNQVVRSPGSYDDNRWHHAVGVVGDGGMLLYVNGVLVASRADVTTGRSFDGYWRIGGDTLSGWPSRPANDYFTGDIDEVAVYTHSLSASQVRQHYQAASRPNEPPVAAFTATVTGLTVQFASTSSDPDGSLTSYDWDFGDGTNGTQADPTKTYGADGAYDVTLTVTDDRGATDSTTQQVTVSTPSALVQDDFGRSVTSGWGSAPSGGAWTLSGGSGNFSVSGGTGRITLPAAGSGPRATLGAVPVADTDATITFSLNKLPNGSGAFLSLASRATAYGSDAYRAKVRVASDGRLTLSLVSVLANAESTIGSVTLPATENYVVGTEQQIRLQTEGTAPTTLRARTWQVGASEPTTWQVQGTNSAATLQTSRGVGVATYLSGAATNAPVVASFDDLIVTHLGG